MSSPGEEVRNYYREEGRDAILEEMIEALEGLVEAKSHTDRTRIGYEFALDTVKAFRR